MEKKSYSEVEQKKAAYALNMCTVSVSQILDYNDVYILEQEYDAILNNLNLEAIPKDGALLRILQEILNVISFFRVQKIRRDQQEKEYQQRLKNAIWHAIPSFNALLIPSAGNIATVAVSLATQIGTGYMSYRREKASAKRDKENADIELEIAAIEQLHALQRELFTTSWRMAKEYEYPEAWRLTERQIERYNQILMDSDPYRKYARLEAISDKFCAYPAFWYNFAHTALFIATSSDVQEVKNVYAEKARNHFEKYREMNQFNLLREDQLAAAANLEYAELLFLDSNPDKNKINKIIADAEEKAGTANDILQLCATSYLRANNRDAARRVLKILINEDYNATTNAQLLSRLYVQQYIYGRDDSTKEDALTCYRLLERQVNSCHLFPLPENNEDTPMESLENSFISTQKMLLKKMYRNSINAFAKQNAVSFNAALPAPYRVKESKEEYYGQTSKSIEKRIHDAQTALSVKHTETFVVMLRECGFRYNYIDVLNNTVAGMESLSCFRDLEKHDDLIAFPAKRLRNAKVGLQALQTKMDNGTFNFEDYLSLINKYSFSYFTKDFFDKSKEHIINAIDNEIRLEKIEDFFSDLEQFCDTYHLPSPNEYIQTYKESDGDVDISHDRIFFEYELLCDSAGSFEFTPQLRDKIQAAIQNSIVNVIADPNKVRVYLRGSQEFDSYLKNERLKARNVSIYEIRQRAIAIIDDITKDDEDLILSVDGARLVQHNRIRDNIDFCDIAYVNNGNNSKLQLGDYANYSKKYVKLDVLKAVIDNMDSHLTKAQSQ